MNGTLYVSADDGISGKELWALNITPSVANTIISLTVINAEAAETGNKSAVFYLALALSNGQAIAVIYN
nr:hypothetical protein [Atlanticothrix silvestris]